MRGSLSAFCSPVWMMSLPHSFTTLCVKGFLSSAFKGQSEFCLGGKETCLEASAFPGHTRGQGSRCPCLLRRDVRQQVPNPGAWLSTASVQEGEAQSGGPEFGPEAGMSAAAASVCLLVSLEPCELREVWCGAHPLYNRAPCTGSVSSHRCPRLPGSHLSFPSLGFSRPFVRNKQALWV